MGERLRAAPEPFDFPGILHFRKKSGEVFVAETRVVPLTDAGGKPWGFAGVSRHLPAREDQEVELHHAQKLETLGVMASGIAHEFNNLLVPILGYADLARAGIPDRDPLRQQLEEHLCDAAERAKGLVRQILTFSRKSRPHRAILRPEEPLCQALRLVGATLPSPIRLERRVPAPVGRIRADANQLQQVVVNLCTNAIQAMRREGGRLRVALERRELDAAASRTLPELEGEREAVVLTVQDEGHGISPGNLPQIFDPFFTTKEAGEGTGLGLSVVYGIVTAHGGAVRVESREGEGTTFRLFFPLADEEETESPGLSGNPSGGSEHVLLVDDQESSRKTEEQLLRSMGYRVSAIASGHEAVEVFGRSQEAIDIVLAEYDMPGMTGIHLALELLELRPGLPVLLMSGSDPAMGLEAEKWGVRGHLLKPFTTAELDRALRQAL
jgi:signal transduction histidine kinase/CheY-like chemotaxis protein